MEDICIAAVTSNSIVGKCNTNIVSMEKWISMAAEQNAEIICFPEMNISGYSTNALIRNYAITIPGETTQRILHLARQYDIVIISGSVEKDSNDNIFASQLVIKPDGSVEAYRKLHLAPPEKTVFTAGDSIPMFNAFGLTFGVQLCYDAHFPELSTHMAVNGADVIFLPHASPRGTSDEKYRSWMRHLSARAFDNGVFIVACNQSGNNGNGLTFPGLALVIAPSGNVIEKKVTNSSDMLVIVLEADELQKVRDHKMRYFLPNRRPEIY